VQASILELACDSDAARPSHRSEFMVRLEQVRAEIIERFERVDRRFVQQEQRLERLNQRIGELADRIDELRSAIDARLRDPEAMSARR
jgi:hypothetical protein